MTMVTPADRPAVAELTDWARTLAARPAEWLSRVRLSADGRWYERIHRDDDHEIWLISWLPGQCTGFHDHGRSAGAFAVALGSLDEHDIAGARTVEAGQVRGFGPGYIHDVRNGGAAPPGRGGGGRGGGGGRCRRGGGGGPRGPGRSTSPWPGRGGGGGACPRRRRSA